MVVALNSYLPYLAQILGFWVTCYIMVEADNHLKLLPASILDIVKCLSTLICCPLAYGSSLTQLYPPYLAQILGYVVTCGVKMKHFC